MIIDIHTHFWGKGYIPMAFHRGTAQAWANKEPGRKPEMILPKIEEGLIDPDGRLFIENMDRAGVDTAFIMAADFGIHWCGEEPPTPIEEQLRHYGELQKRYPGRLYGFAFLDPRRKGAVELLERAIQEWGLRGCGEFSLKDISPADEESQPLLRKCAELGVPVLIHTRSTREPLRSKGDFSTRNVSHPDHIDWVLRQYPDLRVIISHVGYPVWWERAAYIAGKHRHCYLDISNWNREMEDPYNLIPKLACMKDMVGAERMCFGSDQSSGRRHFGEKSVMAQWVGFLRKLPEMAKDCGYVFTQGEMDLILGGAARKLFNL